MFSKFFVKVRRFPRLSVKTRLIDGNSTRKKVAPTWGVEMAMGAEMYIHFATLQHNITSSWQQYFICFSAALVVISTTVDRGITLQRKQEFGHPFLGGMAVATAPASIYSKCTKKAEPFGLWHETKCHHRTFQHFHFIVVSTHPITYLFRSRQGRAWQAPPSSAAPPADMRRLPLLSATLVFIGQVSNVGGNSSALSCKDLQLDPLRRGSGDVCAASKVVPGSPIPGRPNCPLPQTFDQAAILCLGAGMRLCTSSELRDDEAAGSGCALDRSRVWSSSTQGCARGFATSQAGSAESLGAHPPKCEPVGEDRGVRCCADAAYCASNECSSLENDGNKCIPAGGYYYCKCAQGWKLDEYGRSCSPDFGAPDRVFNTVVDGSNPCDRDPCLTSLDRNNRCSRLIGGGHSCICNGPIFVGGVGDSVCIAVEDYSLDPGFPRAPTYSAPDPNRRPRPPPTPLPTPQPAPLPSAEPTSLRTAEPTLRPTPNDRENIFVIDTSDSPPRNMRADKSRTSPTDLRNRTPTPGRGANPNPTNPLAPEVRHATSGTFAPTSRSGPSSFETTYYVELKESPSRLPGRGENQDQVSPVEVPESPTNQPTRRPPSNCNREPCSEAIDKLNICSENVDGSYSCYCGGYRFKNTPDRQSCEYIAPACRGNACKRQDSRGNICVDKFDGTYECICDSRSYRLSLDGKDCFKMEDPCAKDPCSSTLDSRNECIMDVGGSHFCKCRGYRFSEAEDKQSCVKGIDPCESNPCNSVEDALNFCIENTVDNTHTCECNGFRWKDAPDKKSCAQIPDPCRNNPCRSLQDPQNVCVDAGDGSHSCTCDGVGWERGPAELTCRLSVSSCRSFPCQSQKDAANKCVDHRNGTHACICEGRHYSVSEDGQKCLFTPNQCILSDPCNTRYDPNNKCDHVCVGGGNCGHTCTCGGNRWELAVDDEGEQICKLVPRPCDTDPCKQVEDVKNICRESGGGLYTCVCGGAKWRVGEDTGGKPICEPLPDPCQGDDARKACGIDSGNLCIDTTIDSNSPKFECACIMKGWEKAEGGSCVAPPNRCTEGGREGPCHVVASSGEPLDNKCIDNQDGTYLCICAARGWTQTYNAQGCVPPVNMCEKFAETGQDPCLVKMSGGKTKCVDNKDGTYKCDCASAPGYTTPGGALRCQEPVNGCLDDPCHHYQDPKNQCNDRKDGTWECKCGGFDWVPEPSTGRASKCVFSRVQNPCFNYTDPKSKQVKEYDQFDPCRMKADSGNTCKDMREEGHVCSCNNATGWQDYPKTGVSLFCVPPENPCDKNPCKANKDFNFCIYDGGGKYHCLCTERGYNVSQDGQSCLEAPDPCKSPDDPCKLTDRKNSCKNNKDGSYTCTCGAAGYKTSTGAQRCLEPTNLCLYGDPCSVRVNRFNQCLFLTSPSVGYRCECKGRGWSTPPDQQSCKPPKNMCLKNNDACRTEGNTLNFCIDENDGTYRCECNAPGYTPGAGFQTCDCPNPCDLGDPCAIREHKDNKCEILNPDDPEEMKKGPNHCGIHKCTCQDDWKLKFTPWGSERCAPPDPCDYDPCFSNYNSGNLCMGGYRGASAYYDPVTDPLNPMNVAARGTAGIPPPPPTQYGYGGSYDRGFDSYSNYFPVTDGFTNSVYPPMPGIFGPQQPGRRSATGAAEMGDNNQDEPRGKNGLTGDSRGEPRTGVVTPYPLHVGNDIDVPTRRVHADLDGGLGAVFFEINSYFCKCEALGWLTPVGAQYCIPPDPCEVGDPCNHNKNRLNRCVPGRRSGGPGVNFGGFDFTIVDQTPTGHGVDYYCECQGHGWYPATDHLSCLPCANPCKSPGDPCGTRLDPTNNCTWEFDLFPDIRRQATPSSFTNLGPAGFGIHHPQCGRYVCSCNSTNGFVSAQRGRECRKCQDACALDPCKSNQDSANICKNIYPPSNAGRLQNRFPLPVGGRDLIYYDNQGGFVQLSEAELDDPYLDDPCGLYECTCNGLGWVVSQGFQSCERCVDPCSLDPCSTTADRNNVCISQFGGLEVPLGGLPPAGRRLFQAGGNSYNNLATYGESCGTYQCVCGGAGWTEVQNAMKCSRCIDPCEKVKNRDPCNIQQNPGNQCITKPTARPGADEVGGFGPQAAGSPASGRRRLLSDQFDKEANDSHTSNFPYHTNDSLSKNLKVEPVGPNSALPQRPEFEASERRQFGAQNLFNLLANNNAYPAQYGGLTNQISQNLPVCGDYECLCAQNSEWIVGPAGRQCMRDCKNKCLTQVNSYTSYDVRIVVDNTTFDRERVQQSSLNIMKHK